MDLEFETVTSCYLTSLLVFKNWAQVFLNLIPQPKRCIRTLLIVDI